MKAALIILRYVVLPVAILVAIIAILSAHPQVFIGLVLLTGVYLTISYFHVRRRLRRLGFRVFHSGRDEILYEELFCKQLRSLKIPGEMLMGAPHVIYIPTDLVWHAAMPEWARDRKAEILQRVSQELGTKKYNYQEANSANEQIT